MKNCSLLFLLLLCWCGAVGAVEESYDFDNAAQRESFGRLTAELRCPMCQNQNIADSDAMIAHDMRRKVYSLLKEGKTEADVIDYMKARYGDFVYYKPPVTAVTLWLWLGPVLFVALAMLIVVFKRKTSVDANEGEKLARAEAMLEKDEQ